MPARHLIIRLEGKDADGRAALLLVYRLDGAVEIVATEREGADAAVVLAREQAIMLGQALTIALVTGGGDNAS